MANDDGQRPGKGLTCPKTPRRWRTTRRSSLRHPSARSRRPRWTDADYDELKAKAAKFDEAEEASKSELQKAVEERDKFKAELDKMKAEAARAEQVVKVAAEQGVDAALLARMSGDVEDNAKFLKEQMDAQPKHGAAPDNGEAKERPAHTDIPLIF